MRYYISACCILIALFTVLLAFPRAALAAENGDTLICEQLDSLIFSPFWEDRMTATLRILGVPNLDTIWAVNTLISVIENEYNNPSTELREAQSYLSYSQRIIRQNIFNLVSISKNKIDTIQNKLNAFSGKSRYPLIIALAMLKEESVHDDIRSLLETNSDPLIRGLAALSLGAYKDTLDIPILLNAMHDTFTVTVLVDYAPLMDGRSPEQIVHPVAWDAYTSLVNAFGIIPDDTSKVGFRHIDKNK